MTESNLSEQDAIEKAIEGNPSAYRFLIEKHKNFAFTIAIRIVKNREDTEEVVQDSFVRAFRALENFKGTGKFSTWLYRIVYNTALTKIRNKKILMDTLEAFPDEDYEFDIPDNYTGTFEKLVQADQAALLHDALDSLSEAENLVITLYYMCDHTIDEITTITRWNPSTIKIRLFRARQKLYTELSKQLKKEINELI